MKLIFLTCLSALFLTGAKSPDDFGTASCSYRIYSVKCYGATGNGLAWDTPFVQQAIDLADANGGGVVYFPNGQYRISGVVVGTLNTIQNGRSSNVSLVGESKLGAIIKYDGPSDGTAVRFNKNKYGRLENLTITNLTGSRGATTGLETSGPSANGTESNGNILQGVLISGFHFGWHTSAGPNATGSTSSEMTAINLDIYNCDYGLYNNNWNALNINLFNLSVGGNTYGVFAFTAGVFIHGGSAWGNTIADLVFYNGGTNGVYDFRTESTSTFIQAVSATGSASIFVANCDSSGANGSPNSLYGANVYVEGGEIELNACNIGGPIKVSSAFETPSLVDVSIVNCKVKDSRPFRYVNVNQNDSHYRIRGTRIYSTDINAPTLWPNSEGVTGPGPDTYTDWYSEPVGGGLPDIKAATLTVENGFNGQCPQGQSPVFVKGVATGCQ